MFDEMGVRVFAVKREKREGIFLEFIEGKEADIPKLN